MAIYSGASALFNGLYSANASGNFDWSGFWQGAGTSLASSIIGFGFGQLGSAVSASLGINSTFGVAAVSGVAGFAGGGLASYITTGEWNWNAAIIAGTTAALFAGMRQYDYNHTVIGIEASNPPSDYEPSGAPTGVGDSDRKLMYKIKSENSNVGKMMKKENINKVTVKGQGRYIGVKVQRDNNGNLVVTDCRSGVCESTYPLGVTVTTYAGNDIYIGWDAANDEAIFTSTWAHEFNHAYLINSGIKGGVEWHERICYRLSISRAHGQAAKELFLQSLNEYGNAGPWNSFIDKHWRSYVSPFLQ
jgi:hypothetical protein